jgi:hypothetical protein
MTDSNSILTPCKISGGYVGIRHYWASTDWHRRFLPCPLPSPVSPRVCTPISRVMPAHDPAAGGPPLVIRSGAAWCARAVNRLVHRRRRADTRRMVRLPLSFRLAVRAALQMGSAGALRRPDPLGGQRCAHPHVAPRESAAGRPVAGRRRVRKLPRSASYIYQERRLERLGRRREGPPRHSQTSKLPMIQLNVTGNLLSFSRSTVIRSGTA